MLDVINKGIRILRKDGFFNFNKRVLAYSSRNCFSFGTYYLFQKSLSDTAVREPALNNSDFILKVIRTSSEIDDFISEGFQFGFFQDIYDIKELLNKGKILFCVFKNKEWAHSSWVSLDNNSIVDPFFKGKTSINSACIGHCATNPTFRGLGIYPFVITNICGYLNNNGKSTVFMSTRKKNISSINGIKKAGFTIYKEGYHFILCGWSQWREISKNSIIRTVSKIN